MDLNKIDSMYIEFQIPKGNGKYRHICAPVDELKTEQKKILYGDLPSIRVHGSAYGFVNGRSIYDNAKRHLGNVSILTMDVKDFFDSVTSQQVFTALTDNGVNKEKAEYIAKVCTRFGRLPQGAPTSPALTNIVVKPLDKKLCKMCEALGLTYTRYADDLTISGEFNKLLDIKPQIISILNKYGFRVNGSKTHTIGKHRQQNVTGIVVNRHPNVSQKDVRAFRGCVHNVERDINKGLIKTMDDIVTYGYPMWSSMYGYANFLSHTNRKYEVYLDQLNAIKRKLFS